MKNNLNINDIFSFEIQKIKKSQIQEYDEFNRKDIEGRHTKTFYRIDSKLLSSQLELLKADDGRYITYLGGIIKEGLVPEKISVLAKVIHQDDLIAEVIGSKLCHYFGLNTCLNFAGYAGKEEDKKYLLISVDFAREGEELITLDETGLDICRSLSFNFQEFDDMINENRDYEDIPQGQVKTVRNQIALSLLVRDVLFGDKDFCFSHLSYLLNDKANSLKLINYDYEDSFRSKILKRERKSQMKFYKQNFPEVYADFINKANALTQQKDSLQVNYKNKLHKTMVDIFFTRAQKVLDLNQELEEDDLFDNVKTKTPEL